MTAQSSVRTRTWKRRGPSPNRSPTQALLVGNTEILYPRLTAEQRVEVFQGTDCGAQSFHFANFDLVPEVRWDEVPGEYLPQVMRDQPNDEFVRLLQRCMADLKDGHTDVASVWGTGPRPHVPPCSSAGSRAKPSLRRSLRRRKSWHRAYRWVMRSCTWMIGQCRRSSRRIFIPMSSRPRHSGVTCKHIPPCCEVVRSPRYRYRSGQGKANHGKRP